MTSFLVIQAARPALVARQIVPTMRASMMPHTLHDLMYFVSMTYARRSGKGIMVNWNMTLFKERVRRLK